jgi:hypothetical protein
MAAKRTSRVSGSSPLGGGGNLNECRSSLAECAQQLGRVLKDHKSEIPIANQIKFHKTLVTLKLAHSLIKGIGCAGPFMSFELKYVRGDVKADRIRRPRRAR